MDATFRKVLVNGIDRIDRKIPCLHRGGCGIFTLLLYDALWDIGIKTVVVELFDDYPSWSRYHIVLKYNDLYIDSFGVNSQPVDDLFVYEREMKLNKLRVEAWDDSIWFNGEDSFDRNHIIKLDMEIGALMCELTELVPIENNYKLMLSRLT
jgi:hypothetical protein